MKNRGRIYLITIASMALSAVLIFWQWGRQEETLPKPRGYFRIDLPEKSYTNYDSKCPFSLEVPVYSQVELFRDRDSADSCWFNISFPRYNAKVHCTYLPVGNNFDNLIAESYGFAAKHEIKASGLRRSMIDFPERKMYGIFYDITGEAASQVQFYVTDSVRHFLRGSLYFNNKPNPDSISPVLEFIREDIVHMTETIRWRD